MPRGPDPAPTCQRQFHARFGHLRDPHVRTLAWLLHSPDMLDASWPGWEGRVVALTEENPAQADDWLTALDLDPSDLHAHLKLKRHTRLGRYAEQLLAWHFARTGLLYAQGVQVRDGERTLGEFDFLLERDGKLLHRELATKVYLLRSEHVASQGNADYFVGPNLADTLGAKVSKIIHRQLALSSHASAESVLPRAVDNAAAWMKGWLFYPRSAQGTLSAPGLSAQHCRGSWVTLEDFSATSSDPRYLMLERLQWLTPQACSGEQTLSARELLPRLEEQFAKQSTPIMLAEMEEVGERFQECARSFVVPQGWRSAALKYLG